jgi:hypothetical protein
MHCPRIGVPLSLALHVVVALVASRFAWQMQQPIAKPPIRAIWLTAPIAPPAIPPAGQQTDPIPQQPIAPNEEITQPAKGLPPRPTDQVSPSDSTPTATQPPTPSPRFLDDLSEARQRALESALQEEERALSYRSFTFPGTLGEQQSSRESERHRRAEAGLQAPLTAFDSPSKGRAGLSEQTAFGYVRWLSDECYQISGNTNLFLLPSAQALSGPTTACVRARPRGDLFENAKPSYLMDASERDATAERLQRLDRLRRPTTGTAMSLEE